MGNPFVDFQLGAATQIALVEIVQTKPPTPSKTDRATLDGFVNDRIHKRRSRSANMRFNYVIDMVICEKFLVYWVAGEHNLVDYFSNHHPSIHHSSNQIAYLIPTSNSSKYT